MSLTDEQVSNLRPRLAERTRASRASAESFREPEVGLVSTASSARHHFVVGRRGAGKSMLLLNVERYARARGLAVTYINVEELRDNPYPDVLIRLLLAVIEQLDRELGGWRDRRARRRIRKTLRTLRSELEELLSRPDVVDLTVAERRTEARQVGLDASAQVGAGDIGRAEVAAQAGKSRSTERTTETQAAQSESKIEGLRRRATDFRRVLQQAVDSMGGGGLLVILDDFYYIPRADQPDVLAYLHQVVKDLGIWLKIGAVDHRLRAFVDGDPPRGLQPQQDAGTMSMDLTLSEYEHTTTFLEGILGDICAETGMALDDLATREARTRLVLASGGVPRDYLNLVEAALSKSTKRSASGNRPRNKITAEDVNEVAPTFLQQREDELNVDAARDERDALRARFSDIAAFCLQERRTNVFTVEARLLEQEDWGRQIAALADLRFVHRIGNTTVKSSSVVYTGVRYDAFTIDLSAYVGTRVTKNLDSIEFWTTDGWQKLRGARFVYRPDRETAPTDEDPRTLAGPEQMTFPETAE